MPEVRGEPGANTKRFAIVVSKFNSLVTQRLLTGAQNAFREHGALDDAVDVFWVPGSFELPLVAKRLAADGRYAAVVCLGAVIRGETAHFDHVAREAAAGIAAASRETGVPILFGVLTTDTLEQALDRAGGKNGDKGHDAALGAMEMASLMTRLPQNPLTADPSAPTA